MGDAFARETGHLSAQHGAFLAHWHRLLDLEEAGLLQKRSEIWSLHGVHHSQTDIRGFCPKAALLKGDTCLVFLPWSLQPPLLDGQKSADTTTCHSVHLQRPLEVHTGTQSLPQ